MSLKTSFKAVIFDFGGVFTSSPFEAFARYERARGLPENLIRTINAANHEDNAWARFERAELTLDEFDAAFAAEARALGHHVPGRDVIPLLRGDFRPDMIEALRRIHQVMKTGCITNNVPANVQGTDEAKNLYRAPIMAEFDHVIESAKVGLRKPDPRIYQMMLDALGVDGTTSIYLDDLGVNLKPARQMGMATIKVTSGPQAISELEQLTGLKLS